jgi:transposase
MDDAEITPNGSEILRSARMSAPTSSVKQRVEVITRGARRSWRPEEKREIVLASLAPGAMASAICRQHGIGSGQLSVWRQQLREGKLGHPSPPVLNFAEAVVRETPALLSPDDALPVQRQSAVPAPRQRRQARGPSMSGELIEIALPNGMIVRVGADVDQAALGRVLAALKSA